VGSTNPTPAWQIVHVTPSHDKTSQAVVLYNASSKQFAIHDGIPFVVCPTCHSRVRRLHQVPPAHSASPSPATTSNYFAILEDVVSGSEPSPSHNPLHISSSMFNDGYFKRFFVLGARLGSGACGAVFHCTHMLDNIPLGQYAVKKVPVGDNHSWLLQVLAEVRSLEKLTHPNVIAYRHTWLEMDQIADFGPTVPCLYILQEYADGGSLASYLQWNYTLDMAEHPFLPLSDVCAIMRDTASGLSYLHSSGIIHRDIKLENLLLISQEKEKDNFTPATVGQFPYRVVITDFGEALDLCVNATHSSTGNTGTVQYCSPEVLMHVPGELVAPDPRSDIWSLGVVLCVLLHGVTPFCGMSVDEAMACIKDVSGEVPIPSKRQRAAEAEEQQLEEEDAERLVEENLTLQVLEGCCRQMLLRAMHRRPTAAEIWESLSFQAFDHTHPSHSHSPESPRKNTWRPAVSFADMTEISTSEISPSEFMTDEEEVVEELEEESTKGSQSLQPVRREIPHTSTQGSSLQGAALKWWTLRGLIYLFLLPNDLFSLHFWLIVLFPSWLMREWTLHPWQDWLPRDTLLLGLLLLECAFLAWAAMHASWSASLLGVAGFLLYLFRLFPLSLQRAPLS
jgi:serine/threonine protein kinase